MNNMTGDAVGETNGENEGGPMWGRFFDSIGHDDDGSVISGSHAPTDAHSFQHSLARLQQSPHSEVHPNDSASVVDDEPESALAGYPKHRAPAIASVMGTAASVPVDDGTYVFKFRTPSGRTHRFQARHDNVENLRDIVSGKLSTDPFFTEFQGAEEGAPHPDPLDFLLSYTDADGDSVVITSDSDVSDAVKIAREAHSDRVVLFIQGGKEWTEAGAGKSEAKAAEVSAAAHQVEAEVAKAEAVQPESVVITPPAHVPPPPPIQDQVFGIPKDLLLPASIGALAAVIIGVFTISRLTRDSY